MKNFAVVENGIVTNVVVAESPLLSNWIEVSDGAQIGWIWDGSKFSPPAIPAISPSIDGYTTAVQIHLDTKAKERNYDGILSACTYSTSSVPKFAAEGQACVAWRDAVWAACYQIMAEVEAGQRQPPTIPELLDMLPTLIWPEVQ